MAKNDWTAGSEVTPAQLNVMGSEINANTSKLSTIATGADAGSITPEQYGAVGNGSTNDSVALQNALNALDETKTLIIDSGKVYAHTAVLTLTTDGGTIRGGGEIRATAENTSAFIIQGDHVTVEDVKFTCPTTTTRGLDTNHHKIVLDSTTGTVLRRVVVDKSKGGGIKVQSSSYFEIDDCRTKDTLADAFHITHSSAHGVVSNCHAENCGDDAFAVVSYEPDGIPCSDIVVHGFTVKNSSAGGAVVVGGTNIRYYDGHIDTTATAGISVSCSSSPPTTFGVSDVFISNVRVINANTDAPTITHGAVLVSNGRGTGYNINNVFIGDISVHDTDTGTYRQVGLVRNSTGALTNIVLGRMTFTGNELTQILDVSAGVQYWADPSITGIYTTPVGDGVIQLLAPFPSEAIVKASTGAADVNLNLDPTGIGRLKAEGGNLVPYWVAVPATATSTGKTGQIAVGGGFLYICTAANTWLRTAVATW